MRLFSPAKVNLLLAVTGKRDDGFHKLVSLVAPITIGDWVTVALTDRENEIVFECTDPDVPSGDSNLVVQAARSFLAAQDSVQGMEIRLEKHIPMEAGLGGGSSNAATTLLILNQLFEKSLSFAELADIAASLGSDCPLFLHESPVLMRGRGEEIEVLPPSLIDNLEGQLLAVFKPNIGISTAWAYDRLAANREFYANQDQVEATILKWQMGSAPLEDILFNSFEAPVFEKFVAFPVLFDLIRSKLGLPCLMSGSGSSCFALLNESSQAEVLQTMVKEAFGGDIFFEICCIGLKKEFIG
jgi:4-diphosphocytidyl-2-C-methyl-D-erythritol kinase